MSRAESAVIELARSAAAEGKEQFGLTHLFVWVVADDGTVMLAGSAGDGMPDRAMTAEAVSSALHHGGIMKGEAMCLPLRAGTAVLGLVECHAPHAIGFAEAAKIEAWASEFTSALASLEAATELSDSPRGHLVVADDDPSIRKLLQTLLTRNGFTVSAVENGQLACERVVAESPDLVLLDWMMPILDGRSAAARLKNDPRTRHIPVVMLTSQARIEDKVSALEAGAQDYLTKPFDSRELVARIEQQLRWRKLLADDETPQPEPAAAPRSAAPAQPAVDDGEEAPAPPNGDYWSAAIAAQQVGKLRHALAYYVQEAENCDRDKQFARAAIAFRSGSAIAGQLQNLDLSNKLLRLAGKMYLCLAETAKDGKQIQDAYVNAGRCFLSAGNLKLARKSVEIAESMHAVMGDDRPSALS